MKTRTPKIAKGFRRVESGEVLRGGDEYFDRHNGKWYPTHCIGKPVGIPNCTSLTYRRQVHASLTAGSTDRRMTP